MPHSSQSSAHYTHIQFKIFKEMVRSSDNHTAKLEKFVVWANFKGIARPTDVYQHKITINDGVWTCTCSDGRPCWENRIRGLFCSHMIAYAIQTIRNGGSIDLRAIGKSSLTRHRKY